MVEVVGYRISKEGFERPPKELVEKFRKVATPDATDAMRRWGAMHPSIKPIPSGIKMVGPAVTVKTRNADNLMVHKGLHMCQPNDVLVVDAEGLALHSVWGGLMTTTAMKKGLAGVVIDGSVRDASYIRELKFPIFARGISPMNGDKDGPGEINFPIQCGGVPVKPGDIILGDDDGVVVIPLEDAEKIIAKAQEFAAKTVKRTKEILAGKNLVPAFIDKTLKEKGLLL